VSWFVGGGGGLDLMALISGLSGNEIGHRGLICGLGWGVRSYARTILRM
jgi:hypothetical protein